MRFSYDVYNAPSDRPPLIFLHGLGDWRHCWRMVAPKIAATTRRQVYTPDARNHGNSPRSADLDYDVLTQDLVEFMDELGIDSAVILGHSMGGRTAINFALKYPKRTECLIVEDMTPKNIYSGSGTFVPQIIELILEVLKSVPPDMDLDACKGFLLDLVLSNVGGKFVDREVVENWRNMIDIDMIAVTKTRDEVVPVANVEAIKSMLNNNALVQNLPDSGLVYPGDALFLYGSKAFYNLEKDESFIKKLFPKARIKRIDGSTHYIHIDNRNAFVTAVSEFIVSKDLAKSKY